MKSHRAMVGCTILILLAGIASASPAQLPRSELFTFHSDAFVNLHHFLYRWGQVGPGAEVTGLDPRIRLRDEDLQRYRTMDEADREEWDLAATFYRLDMIDRDLLFDEGMLALRDCLVLAGNYCDRIEERDQAALDILNRAMPVYRRVFWSSHNAENRRWMDDIIPRAQRFESEIAPRLAAAYDGEWPERRNRVDVTVYANTVGAYTTADGHITVTSIDPAVHGWFGLEMLFHESSHADSLERPLIAMIDRAFDAIGADTPPDLWHMTIFYTAGHITRQVLTAAGVDYPQTYAEATGIYERREGNRRAKEALDNAWNPALQAGTGYRQAMGEVARAWR